MSFASQIISSVNKDSSRDLTTSGVDTYTGISEGISEGTSEGRVNEDTDYGFESDINTQIKDTPNVNGDIVRDPSASNSDEQMTTAPSSLNRFTSYGSYFLMVVAVAIIVNELYGNFFPSLGSSVNDGYDLIVEGALFLYTFISPILDAIYQLLYGSTKQVIQNVAVGANVVSEKDNEMVDADPAKKNSSKKVKVNKKLEKDIKESTKKDTTKVEEDSAMSAIQKKSDWCYIGEDQGRRVCALRGDNECMSGMIYPTLNACLVK